jgi:hypothetical protein
MATSRRFGIVQIPEIITALTSQPEATRFKEQILVSDDSSRHIALLCGRRAGKTEELVYRAVEALADYARCHVVFIGLTKASAREIFFAKIRSLNNTNGWGLKLNEQHLTVYNPYTFSTLIVTGSDTREDLDKIRGIERLALLECDECGQWRPSLLEYVIDEAGGPALADLNGTTILSGTPGRILNGYWYKVTTGGLPGWSPHRWTIYQNPYIEAEEYLNELLRTKQWDRSTAVFRREYLAEWCTDSRSIVMSDFGDKNIKPCVYNKAYKTYLVLDFGVVHNTAFTVMGHKSSEPAIKVFHSEQHRGWAPTQVADRAREIKEKYGCSRLVGDLGGMGKAHAAEMLLKHHIAIEPADKRDKLTGIETTNDRFRMNILDIDPSCEDLIDQCRAVQWDEYHTDIADGQEDDALDTLVYGNKTIYHTYTKPIEVEQPVFYKRPPRPYWVMDMSAP